MCVFVLSSIALLFSATSVLVFCAHQKPVQLKCTPVVIPLFLEFILSVWEGIIAAFCF